MMYWVKRKNDRSSNVLISINNKRINHFINIWMAFYWQWVVWTWQVWKWSNVSTFWSLYCQKYYT